MRNLMSFRDRFRRGLFTNVFLHARLEARYADRPGQVKQEVKRVFKKELFVANVRKMRKLVERLQWDPPQGVWTAYGERNSYTDDDARRKDEFVRQVATSQPWNLVWDIGANNGRYSRIAAEGAKTVIAVDADQGPVELLYRDLRSEGNEQILTLTMNLADPSPGPRLARARAQGRCPTAASRTWCWRSPSYTTSRSAPTCRSRSSSTGSPRSDGARDRVPHARGPDGQEAARAQARRAPPRLRARLLRAHSGRGVRRRALERLESGTRVLYFARPKRG